MTSPRAYDIYFKSTGEMPEWSIGPVSKTGVGLRLPRVQIPVSPPFKSMPTFSFKIKAVFVRK